MADGDLTATGNASGDLLHLSVGEDGGVLLPEGLSLSDASFSVQGDDLVMTWPDGAQASVEGFGAGDMPTLSDDSGIEMSGDMAFQMAQLDSPSEVSTEFNFEAVGEVITGTDGSPIGTVEEADGAVWAIRVDGTRVELNVGDPVFQGDVLESGPDGSVGVILADDTTFSMGESGQMVLDEMVYDPSTQEGSVSVSVLEGVFTFVSGQVAKTDPDAMSIDTPVATIGIRGTQVGINLNEESGMDVILMEEADGFVGEVVLQNDGGVEILNTAFAASKIASFDAAPQAGFTMDTVSFLQSFGASLRSLPGVNNANTYGADQQDLDQLIQDAIQEAFNASEDEAEAEAAEAEAELAEAEAEAADAEAEADLAEAEAQDAEEALQNLQEQAAAEAEAQADEAQEALEDDAQQDGDQESDVTVLPVNPNEPIPQLELVQFEVEESRTNSEIIFGTDEGSNDQQDDERNDDVIQSDNTDDVETLSQSELTAADLQGLIAGRAGGSGVVTPNADGTFSVTQGGDGRVDVDFSGRSESFVVSGGDDSDSVILGSGNDTISTGEGSDYISAGAGNDIVDAGTGDDIIVGGEGSGNDTFIGGSGADWVVYDSAQEGYDLLLNLDSTSTYTIQLNGEDVTIDPSSASDAPDSPGWIDSDELIEIENILGGAGDDYIFGSDDDNVLMGGAGDDYLFGGAGDDTLIGGVVDGYFANTSLDSVAGGDFGNDVLVGGEGTDTVMYQASFDDFTATVDADGNVRLSSIDADGNEVFDTLVDVEYINFDGDVFTIAVPPVISVTGSVTEDSGIPIEIPLDTEGTLGIDSIDSVTISGIPEGAVLSYVGTDGETIELSAVNGTVDLTGEQLQGLQITPVENDSSDFSLSISATTVLGQTNTQENFTVQVTPVVDTELQITGPETVSEGQPIAIDVSRTLDLDSENLTTMNFDGQVVESVSVEVTDQATGEPIDGISASVAVMSDGDLVTIQLPIIDGVISVPVSLAESLIITTPDDYEGTVTIEATATVIHEDETFFSQDISTSFNVAVEAQDSDLTITAPTGVGGGEDTAIPLEIGVSGGDVDGVNEIVVSGIPTGASLSAGTDNGDGTWTLTVADLDGISLTPPADSDVDFSISVTAIGDDFTSDPFTIGIDVTPVADAPTLTIGNLVGTEDQPISLDASAALTDTDGSEAITSITLSGIPDGAVVSTSTGNLVISSAGTASLSPDQLSSLTVTPPANFSGNMELTLSVTSTETNGGSATTSQTFTLDVQSVADVPNVTVENVTGTEDNAVPLDISVAVDGGEDVASITIDVSQLPNGTQLSAGTDNGDGTVTVQAADIAGLTLTPPTDYSGELSLQVMATSTDGSTSDGYQPFTVSVSGVADAPSLNVGSASGVAGETIALNLSASSTDIDGSESVSVEIGGIPEGSTVLVGDQPLSIVNGTVTLTQAQLSSVAIVPATDFSGTMDLTITAISSEDGTTAQTADTLSIEVEGAVVEPPVETVSTEDMIVFDIDVLGNIDLSSLNSLTDNVDLPGEAVQPNLGLEDLVEVTISGLPAGAVLTAGTDQGDGTWSLSAGDLEGLQIALDPDQLPDADGDGQAFDFSLQYDAIFDEEGANAISGSIDFDHEGDAIEIGGDGDDVIIANDARSEVYGLEGDDYMMGKTGGNEMHGGSGDDTLLGSTGKDVLYGDSGNDILSGGQGTDELYGGIGDDELLGGKGSDILVGGEGSDILTGGAGTDTFIFDADSGADIITDIMAQDTIVFEGEEFHAEDMIFREAEDGDVEIAFSNNDTTVKLEGVKYDDMAGEDGQISTNEGYSVTSDDGKISVSIDGSDGTT